MTKRLYNELENAVTSVLSMLFFSDDANSEFTHAGKSDPFHHLYVAFSFRGPNPVAHEATAAYWTKGYGDRHSAAAIWSFPIYGRNTEGISTLPSAC